MFTPIETSIGALMLHQATSILLHNNGNVLGMSDIIRRLVSQPTKGTVAFFAGMAASFPLLRFLLPELLAKYPPLPSTAGQALVTIVTGMLVGWGTAAARGCTSGHMLCGLSRLSGRSALAVGIFFPTALITHHLVHPSLLTTVCTSGIPCYTGTYPTYATLISLVGFAATTTLASRTVPRLLEKLSRVSKDNYEDQDALIARTTTEFFAGLEFGLGLHISQMSDPAKVAAFLSFPNLQAWDPSMMLVLVFGILPSLIENMSKGFQTPPKFSDKYDLPSKTLAHTDWKFVAGAATFGVGWGLSGTCPGPAVLRALAQPAWGLLWVGGFWLGGLLVGD